MNCKGTNCSTEVISGFCHKCKNSGNKAPKFRGPILDQNGVRPNMGLARLKREDRELWLVKTAARKDCFLLGNKKAIVVGGAIKEIAPEEVHFFM